jgi:hypothetical protein
MKTSTLAATFSALTPGTRNGANASASNSASSTAGARSRQPRTAAREVVGENAVQHGRVAPHRFATGYTPCGPPQQNGHHQRDVGKQRHFGSQKAGVVGHQPHQQCPNQRPTRGAQPADDDDDENQHVHLRTHLRHHTLLVQAPHHARPDPPAHCPPQTRRQTGGGCGSPATRPSRGLAHPHVSANPSWYGQHPGQQRQTHPAHHHGHEAVLFDGGIAQVAPIRAWLRAGAAVSAAGPR